MGMYSAKLYRTGLSLWQKRAEKAESELAELHAEIDGCHKRMLQYQAELAEAEVLNKAWQQDFAALAIKKGEAEAERDKTKRIVEIERSSSHAFCPDCRDKVKTEPCLRCQLQKAEAERDRLREALVGLLHHMPLRGEPVTAKEVAIARAKASLAGGHDQEPRCDCYPSPENWGVCRDCGKDLGDSDSQTRGGIDD